MIFIAIIFFALGIVVAALVGAYFEESQISGKIDNKESRKKRVMNLFDIRDRVKNDDVERLLKVSDATARRYLDELEKEGKIIQHGKVGKAVYYSKK